MKVTLSDLGLVGLVLVIASVVSSWTSLEAMRALVLGGIGVGLLLLHFKRGGE